LKAGVSRTRGCGACGGTRQGWRQGGFDCPPTAAHGGSGQGKGAWRRGSAELADALRVGPQGQAARELALMEQEASQLNSAIQQAARDKEELMAGG